MPALDCIGCGTGFRGEPHSEPRCDDCLFAERTRRAIEASMATAHLEPTECVPAPTAVSSPGTPVPDVFSDVFPDVVPDVVPDLDPNVALLLMENTRIKVELCELARDFLHMTRIQDATQHQLAELRDLLQYSGGPDDRISRMQKEIDDLKRRVTEAEAWA